MQRLLGFFFILTLLLPFLVIDGPNVFAQIEFTPNNPTVVPALDPVEAAHDHFHERRYVEAIKMYEELLEKGVPRGGNTYSPLQQSQKDSIRLMLGQSYSEVGDDPAAQRIFREIVNENPDGSYATQAAHRLGNLYWQRYQFRQAILQCKQILDQHPNTAAAATAAYLVGQYQQTLGKTEEAVESYKYFLDNFPGSPYRTSAVNSLIRLYIVNARYTEAKELIQNRLRNYPDDLTLLAHLAELYQQQGEHPRAIELYRQAIEKDQDNINLRRKLGDLYAKIGEPAQAINEWKKIVADEANQADQHQQLGAIYLSHKMYREAIAAYQQAIRLNPQNGYLYTQLAAAYKIQGQNEQAAAVYIDGLQRVGLAESQREPIWEAMLEIYEGARHKALQGTLIDQLQKQHLRQPQNPDVTMTLGELLFHAGRVSRALETFRKLHQSHPTHTDLALERYAEELARNVSPRAADFYKALINSSSNSTRVRSASSKLALFYQKMEKWEDAVALLKELVKNRQASIQNRILLGQLQLHGTREPKAAQMTFQGLLTQRLVTRQLTEAQLGLGECHILLKRYTLAREILEPMANKTHRYRATARKLMGDSYFFAADFEQALKEYNQVIQISKSDQLTNDALEKIALIQNHQDYLKIPLTDYAAALQLYLSGKTEDALQQGDGIFELYPQSNIIDDIWLLMGNIYREEAKNTEAINAYQQVIARESPIAAKALVNIAEIYRQQDDLENATATYTTLITDYPESVIVVHARQQLDEINKMQQKR